MALGTRYLLQWKRTAPAGPCRRCRSCAPRAPGGDNRSQVDGPPSAPQAALRVAEANLRTKLQSEGRTSVQDLRAPETMLGKAGLLQLGFTSSLTPPPCSSA